MPVYELMNPSDPYTFEAPNIEVAGYCAAMLSRSFGAKNVDNDNERSPILFGWSEWFEEHGINEVWVNTNLPAIADAYDSFLIGGPDQREDVMSMLAELPQEKREEWRAKRQDRHRSSMNQIGEAAYARARAIRKKLETNPA